MLSLALPVVAGGPRKWWYLSDVRRVRHSYEECP